MAQKEIVVEIDICDEAEKDGWLVRKLQYVGRRGAPDRMFVKAGRIVFIEFKKLGENPDGLQQREHDRLRGRGIIVHVVRRHDEARKILGLGIYAT